jgi:hypothetical protein
MGEKMKTILNRHYGGIICILSMMFGMPASAALKDDLAAALKNYCVPKCDSDCKGAFQARYDKSTGKCECAGGGIFIYDRETRECFLKCPAGSHYVPQAKCVSGMKKYEITPIAN